MGAVVERFGVGVIEGGTSINIIAQRAELLLDLRSEDPVALEQLVQSVTFRLF
jgi:metal-dependent amidase/aminoacylase/carboxypeptidase family protein